MFYARAGAPLPALECVRAAAPDAAPCAACFRLRRAYACAGAAIAAGLHADAADADSATRDKSHVLMLLLLIRDSYA